MTKTEQLYDVVIYEKATGIVDAVVGTNMRSWDGTGSGRNTAELRVQTAEERINERYAAVAVEAGRYKKGSKIS